MNGARPRPLVLCILDGWGHSESSDKSHNAIFQAKTPNLDALSQRYPHSLLDASELNVGLPTGQMGNSEVGHMNIGAGRVIMQDLPRIDQAIASGEIAENEALLKFVAEIKKGSGHCHLLGLMSPGGVHSHQDHLTVMAAIMADHGLEVNLHMFLDGRDTPPSSAIQYYDDLIAALPPGSDNRLKLATICGRYYAMDRDKRWERVELAYNMLTTGQGAKTQDLRQAIESGYRAGVTDEFMQPIVHESYAGMQDGDGLFCANFRADRVRQILSALLVPDFAEFKRLKHIDFSSALGMTEYSATLNKYMAAIFVQNKLEGLLGEVVAKVGLKQLRMAETEKYPHVTYFFNGGAEAEYPGEKRIMIPSPKVATYDLQPEMSAYELTDTLLNEIVTDQYDLIVVNFANTDMVGHTGDLAAAVKAVEAVDACVGRIWQALEPMGGALLISADHGNAEVMRDETIAQPHTAHTLNKVPFIVIGNGFEQGKISLKDGALADIAPTILEIMHLPKPEQMTGNSLINK